MTKNVTLFRMFHNQRFTKTSVHDTIRCVFGMGLVVFGVGISSVPRAHAGETNVEPYSIFVGEADSYVRSGPSADYYRTDPLTHGQQLEVYAETDNGWLGVRPPSNSFSWIPLDAVDLDGSGEVGTVLEDRTVAWVGTHLGRARDWGWQVQLAQGEAVTIVGRSEREGPDGPMTWLRIVPPSGEFRFIHKSQTVRTSEELVQSIAAARQANPVMFSQGGPIVARNAPTRHRDDHFADRHPSTDRSINDPARIAADPGIAQDSGSSILNHSDPRIDTVPSPDVVATLAPASRVKQTSWQTNAPRSALTEPLPPSLVDPSIRKTQSETALQKPPRPRGLLAAVAFKGKPRIGKIGDQPTPTPSMGSQWVANGFRKIGVGVNTSQAQSPVMQNPETQPFLNSRISDPNILQVSGTVPMPAQNLTAQPAWHPPTPTASFPGQPRLAAPPIKRVSVEQITRVHQEVRDASVQQLEITLSRLMAEQASPEEGEVVAAAARAIARTTPDASIATQARGIAERADGYARLATRRDRSVASTVLLGTLSTTGTPVVPAPTSIPANPLPANAGVPLVPGEPEAMTMSGQLVQVYSARPHSPPFALTDATGRTIAYVTPSPGINLRGHLNTRVTVTGNPGQPTGMDTPHVIAQRADREGPATF